MFDTCRPAGRLFYWVMVFGLVAWLSSRGNAAAPQSGPALTSVIDTVYTASGAPAQGVLIITWPAFTTASGTAVAAGSLDVTLGANGALNVALEANAGASPAGVFYSVVYQVGAGEVRTEYWIVPTTSPTTLAVVRATPGAGTAGQPVSMQYVNSVVAGKANDSAVVHLANPETITGTKTFSVAPNVPTPVATGNVANKAYVDTAVASVGAGVYLPSAGGSMTGPLTLSGAPTSALQAADKQYVDSSEALKADLISGLVPTNELGSGAATALNCLLGNGTWGPCGSSANATAIQSIPVATGTPANGQVLAYSTSTGQYAPVTPSGGTGSVSVTPAANQNITQPLGTQFSANNISGIRYVTGSDNWSASPSGSLAGGTQATVTLTPCPVGVDTSGFSMYYVYLSAQGTPEPAMVTGGTCVAGAASGTIVFTPRNSHSAGYKVSSASSGIQEAVNDACGLPTGTTVGNPNARIVLPATGVLANALPVYGSIYAHCSRALIEGNGTMLACSTRDRCMALGDLVNSNHYGGITLRGVNFTSTVRADGCQITNTQRQSNVVTITTATACSTIQNGDTVNINFTDSTAYWGNHGPVTVTGNTITYSQTGGNIAGATTPGTIAIENAAVEDDATPSTMEDIKSSSGGGGLFNQFFVEDDDQAATIRNFDADGSQGLLCTANHCGSYVYAPGGAAGAAVLSLNNMNISPQCAGNGVTDYGNNSVRITDSVIQGFAMWGVNTQNLTGNYGGTTMENVYMEEGGGPCVHPYEGNYFSATGVIYEGNLQPLLMRGGEQPGGHVPQFGAQSAGTVQYNYYVVANDTTTNWHSAPLFAGFALTNGTGTVTGQFPHIGPGNAGDTMTYDIVRMQPELGQSQNIPSFPVKGACTGGSATACGSVITGQAQCAGLVCTFTDPSTSASTASYTFNAVNWEPQISFWPAVVLLAGDGTQSFFEPTASFDFEPADIVAVNWNAFPEADIRYCSGSSVSGGLFGGAWEECQDGNPNSNNVVGTLLNDGVATTQNPIGTKGRLNFESITSAAHHIITLVDSNLAKTTAFVNFRPPNDANDTYIGLDNPSTGTASAAQLAVGSPVSISEYIGNKGDNTSFLERLTASLKTFNVPVKINGSLTITGSCTGCGGGGGTGSGTVNNGTATQMALYSANGTAVSGDSGLTDTGTTLSYAGSNGILAAAGTFSGNVTVNGQLLVAGPWSVSSPVPGTPFASAGAGMSSLGISNDGNFYISANAGAPVKVATTATSSFFSNLFQEDANDLGEYNGSTAQNLHVYSSYTNSSTWQRTSMGFDATDNLAVIRSENSSSGSAPGLGFWIGSSVRWLIDSTSTLKPSTNNFINLGSTSFAPQTIYAATSFDTLTQGRENFELCNDATTGTLLNFLAVYNGATPACALKAGTANTDGAIGIVSNGSGTAGNAVITYRGYVPCSFDGSTVAGDFVVASTTNAGDCHDAGAARPSGAQVVGRVETTNTGVGTYAIRAELDAPAGGGAAAGLGDPGANGILVRSALNTTLVRNLAAGSSGYITITNASGVGGNPTLDLSTANLFASPALTGAPTAPTQASSDSSTAIATDAFVKAQGYLTAAPVASVFGRTGTVTAASGDYSVAQITGAAPLASPGLTGTPTAPTQTSSDSSTAIATDAFVKAQGYLTAAPVASVFGRTGTVTAASGDYSVAQITGAAPLASPGLTGTPTAPTAAASTNTTQVATTAFAHGVAPPDTAASVWITVPHASASTLFSTSANKAAFFGVMLEHQKTTSQVSYYVSTADTSATTYDLGIYSGTSAGTCTLQAHTGSIAGSTAMTALGHTVSWTGGSVTLQPGRYYLALTASATASTAVIYGDSGGVTFAGGTGASSVGNVTVAAGGTLPGTATCPTDSVQVAAVIPAWLVD